MPDERRPASPPSRRAFLRALAIAPAAAAGCATSRAAGPGAEASAPKGAPSAAGSPAAPSPDEALAPIRSFPLAMEDEPAFVFRAAVPRQQE
jgi:hypothetical protein